MFLLLQIINYDEGFSNLVVIINFYVTNCFYSLFLLLLVFYLFKFYLFCHLQLLFIFLVNLNILLCFTFKFYYKSFSLNFSLIFKIKAKSRPRPAAEFPWTLYHNKETDFDLFSVVFGEMKGKDAREVLFPKQKLKQFKTN